MWKKSNPMRFYVKLLKDVASGIWAKGCGTGTFWESWSGKEVDVW